MCLARKNRDTFEYFQGEPRSEFFLAQFKAALKIAPAVVQTLKVLSFYIATDICILRSLGNSKLGWHREAPTSNLVHNFSMVWFDLRCARVPAECPHRRVCEGVVRELGWKREMGAEGCWGMRTDRETQPPRSLAGSLQAKTEAPCPAGKPPRGLFTRGEQTWLLSCR